SPPLVTLALLHSFPTRRSSDLDYIHLPSAVLKHERMRRFFARITLLWAFVLLANSAVSIWLLLQQSIGTHLLVGPYLLIRTTARSEEHTSELQSRENLVCRLLL